MEGCNVFVKVYKVDLVCVWKGGLWVGHACPPRPGSSFSPPSLQTNHIIIITVVSIFFFIIIIITRSRPPSGWRPNYSLGWV